MMRVNEGQFASVLQTLFCSLIGIYSDNKQYNSTWFWDFLLKMDYMHG